MRRTTRLIGPLTVFFNLGAFGLIFLIIANSNRVEDVLFISSQDGTVAFTLAGLGVLINLTYGYLKWRDRARNRLRERDGDRPTFTGA